MLNAGSVYRRVAILQAFQRNAHNNKNSRSQRFVIAMQNLATCAARGKLISGTKSI